MAQIILNVEDNAPIAKIKSALKLLTGEISVTVKKETLTSMHDAQTGRYAGELDASSIESLEESIKRLL